MNHLATTVRHLHMNMESSGLMRCAFRNSTAPDYHTNIRRGVSGRVLDGEVQQKSSPNDTVTQMFN